MSRDRYPVRWTGRPTISTLPGRIEVSNSGRIREELLLSQRESGHDVD